MHDIFDILPCIFSSLLHFTIIFELFLFLPHLSSLSPILIINFTRLTVMCCKHSHRVQHFSASANCFFLPSPPQHGTSLTFTITQKTPQNLCSCHVVILLPRLQYNSAGTSNFQAQLLCRNNIYLIDN